MAAGKHVPSKAATGPQGPRDATGKVGGHFAGRSGATWPGPSAGDPDGDGDNDATGNGQANNANPVTGSR